MVRIAFVGCGHIHTPAFVNFVNARKNFEVVKVWDHDAARAEKNAKALNSTVAADLDEIYGDPSIEAIVIASETKLHQELVLKGAAAKKHMYIEKPIGFDAAQAREISAAIQKAGVIFQTGYFMRGTSIHLFLKKMIEEKAFGTITRVRHSNCHSGSLGGWFDTEWRWMADPSIAGCGAFGDLGTHSLDILMWLFGRPEKVTANIHVLTARYGKDCDEYGEGMLVFPGNIVATLAAGWVDCANPIVCEICGTEGHAVILNDKLYFSSSKVTGADGSQPWTDMPAPLSHAFELYLDKLEGKDVPLVKVTEAADRNIVMEAMYKAAQAQTWQEVKY